MTGRRFEIRQCRHGKAFTGRRKLPAVIGALKSVSHDAPQRQPGAPVWALIGPGVNPMGRIAPEHYRAFQQGYRQGLT